MGDDKFYGSKWLIACHSYGVAVGAELLRLLLDRDAWGVGFGTPKVLAEVPKENWLRY